MSVEIRSMAAEDYEAVEVLWKASPGVGLSPSDTREGVLRFLESSIDKAHIFVFAENEDAVAFWKKIGWGERSELAILSRYTA